MPTLFERYINGEYEEVYEEIYSLEQDAFLPENFSQIDLVLKETFRRVACNLDIIYKELKNINYQFVPSEIAEDWQTLLSVVFQKIKNAELLWLVCN